MSVAGNGASRPTEWQAQDSRSPIDHGRQILHDTQALNASVQNATDDVHRFLTAEMEHRPFIALGVAAGFGYVLGGGLSSPLIRLLLGATTRMAAALVARELRMRISHHHSAADSF